MLERHASRIVKLDDGRIEFPREEPLDLDFYDQKLRPGS